MGGLAYGRHFEEGNLEEALTCLLRAQTDPRLPNLHVRLGNTYLRMKQLDAAERVDLELKEQVPADIALDVDYRMELQRRDSLPGFPGAAPRAMTETLQEENQEIVKDAEVPVFVPEEPSDPNTPDPELAKAVQSCLDRAKRGSASK